MSSIRRNIRFTPPPEASDKPGQESVLLVDDDIRILTLLSGALSGILGDLPLLKAQTVREALKLASEHPIRLFILDVQLPDGTGLDFHCKVRDHHRNAHTIVITGTPLIVDNSFGERFGTAHVLRKPFDIVELQTKVKALLSTKIEPAAALETFAANLHSLTPTDVIQLKCIGRATTTLRFTSTDGQSGLIHLDKGDIMHAATDSLSGRDAFNRIVSWRGGLVAEVGVTHVRRTIQGSWEGLLMEALRLMDEAEISK